MANRNPVQIERHFKDGQVFYTCWDVVKRVVAGTFHDLATAEKCFPRHLRMFGEDQPVA